MATNYEQLLCNNDIISDYVLSYVRGHHRRKRTRWNA